MHFDDKSYITVFQFGEVRNMKQHRFPRMAGKSESVHFLQINFGKVDSGGEPLYPDTT